MPIPSRWSVPIPRCSLQQWIFGSACGPLPDHKAFIDPDNPEANFLTMTDFRLLAKRVALGLQQAGIKEGDRVLIFSNNNLFFPSIFLGVLMAGGIVTGANPGFVPRELAYQLKDSEAKFLFVAEHATKTAFEAAAEVGLPRENIFVLGTATTPSASTLAQSPTAGPGVRGRVDGARHWTELLAGNLAQASTWSWQEPANPEETTCCLNYSSGTTGVPKGVEISHHSYVANGVGVSHMNRLRPDHAEKQKTDRGLCFLPLYHAYGQTYFIANLPHLRIPVYVMPQFDFPKMLAHIQRFRITILSVVPPIVVLLAKHPLTPKYDLSSIETIGSGAAPLTREVCEEVERLFPPRAGPGGREEQLYVRQGWGMTEVTCTSMSWDPAAAAGPSAGVGEVYPNCAARLVALDGSGAEVTHAGERGELWVTGPTLMRRYWRKPEATAETIVVDADGTRWLRTGDVAFVEEYRPGGIFHVVDRVKELIKVKGNQVAPAELEGILLENPDVADAAVVGVTIRGEEVPRAYVVRSPKSGAAEGDVARWMEGKVSRYKRLKGGVVFMDAIPKNPSGKILRKLLRERAQKEVGDSAAKPSRL
ncbi:acetyl-CoA synthetase-like protein [Parathielavia hyrcaniae]|uniref:Acetyl-CoA synthetase-like protein n=1 Tax=Parathielavia hyrcaniae TaxID=113614 RepID=A0AAN6T3U6_9PEZI|nr:acetyl-CoA synthetase-like protein [Parathielavia hyrcaniae]